MYSKPNGQLEILRQLCHHPLSLTEIVDRTQLDTQTVEQTLKTLQDLLGSLFHIHQFH